MTLFMSRNILTRNQTERRKIDYFIRHLPFIIQIGGNLKYVFIIPKNILEPGDFRQHIMQILKYDFVDVLKIKAQDWGLHRSTVIYSSVQLFIFHVACNYGTWNNKPGL